MGVFKRERERKYDNNKITKTVSWVVKKDGKTWSYNEGNHGKYAKELAELSFKKGEKIENLIVPDKENNCSVLKLYSKTYGYFDVLIDNDDVEKIMPFSWSVSISKDDESKNRVYIRNNELGRIHRYILNIGEYDKTLMVDHISRNTLDNRKSNLRIVTNSENQQNVSIHKTNKTGTTGVYKSPDGKKIYSYITHNGIREQKTFEINKYTESGALDLAIKWRLEKEKEYNFLGANKK